MYVYIHIIRIQSVSHDESTNEITFFDISNYFYFYFNNYYIFYFILFFYDENSKSIKQKKKKKLIFQFRLFDFFMKILVEKRFYKT